MHILTFSRTSIALLALVCMVAACGGDEKKDETGERGFQFPIQKVTFTNNGSHFGSADVFGSAKGVENQVNLFASAEPGETGTSEGRGEYCDSVDVLVTFVTDDGVETYLTGSGSWPNTTPPTTIFEAYVTANDAGGEAKLKIVGREETIPLTPLVVVPGSSGDPRHPIIQRRRRAMR